MKYDDDDDYDWMNHDSGPPMVVHITRAFTSMVVGIAAWAVVTMLLAIPMGISHAGSVGVLAGICASGIYCILKFWK